MPELSRIGIGTIVFVIGAVIYIVNLVASLSRRGKPLSRWGRSDGDRDWVALLLKW
jgi:hypothetical protein